MKPKSLTASTVLSLPAQPTATAASAQDATPFSTFTAHFFSFCSSIAVQRTLQSGKDDSLSLSEKLTVLQSFGPGLLQNLLPRVPLFEYVFFLAEL
jgi:hypothetical protein